MSKLEWKKFLGLACVLLALLGTPTQAQVPTCISADDSVAAWWPGDASGEDIKSGLTASPNNGVEFTEDGMSREAFVINCPACKGAHLSVADDPRLDFPPGADFTIDLWVSATPTPPQADLSLVDKSFYRLPTMRLDTTFFRGQLGFLMGASPNPVQLEVSRREFGAETGNPSLSPVGR